MKKSNLLKFTGSTPLIIWFFYQTFFLISQVVSREIGMSNFLLKESLVAIFVSFVVCSALRTDHGWSYEINPFLIFINLWNISLLLMFGGLYLKFKTIHLLGYFFFYLISAICLIIMFTPVYFFVLDFLESRGEYGEVKNVSRVAGKCNTRIVNQKNANQLKKERERKERIRKNEEEARRDHMLFETDRKSKGLSCRSFDYRK